MTQPAKSERRRVEDKPTPASPTLPRARAHARAHTSARAHAHSRARALAHAYAHAYAFARACRRRWPRLPRAAAAAASCATRQRRRPPSVHCSRDCGRMPPHSHNCRRDCCRCRRHAAAVAVDTLTTAAAATSATAAAAAICCCDDHRRGCASRAVLLVAGVLRWEDVSNDSEAWNTFVWFATLLMMATALGQLGLIAWFTEQVRPMFVGIGWVAGFLGLVLVYFYSHYFFASISAHVSAMYAPFLAVALAIGVPPLLAALVLGFSSNLFACLTHYGTAPAPILFGSGNCPLGLWWRVGAIVSVVNIAIWIGVGGAWWRSIPANRCTGSTATSLYRRRRKREQVYCYTPPWA